MSEPPITRLAGSFGKRSNGPVSRVVIHDEEYQVGPNSAEVIAGYFAGLPANGDVSAHYIVDSTSEQHCVPDLQVAYANPPNTGTISIEQDGYAHFTLAEWKKPGSWATICRAAARTAELCIRFSVPLVWLSTDDLKAGKRGITSHQNMSLAFRQSSHVDPGGQFPYSEFLALVGLGMGYLADVRAFQAATRLVVDGDAGIKTVMMLGDALLSGQAVLPPPTPPRAPDVNRFANYETIFLGIRDAPLSARSVRMVPVQALQNSLNIITSAETGPGRLAPDGIFGRATEHVLRNFQRFFGLTVDGICGPQTWGLLDYLLDRKGR